MYYDYFGLEQPPFRITPDTSLFFPGGNRGAILEALVYAILNGEGIVKVVGEVGSGKTMLCRMLEVELPDNVEIVYLANPSLSPDNILHAIAYELKLNVDANDERLKVMNRLQHYLLERHAENRQVVVFVEEAQSMPIATLEEIRLLSNLETGKHKLLQIVLFGQPELDQMIADRQIRQLKERITYSFNLNPLKTGEVKDYLNSRLRACGYRAGEVFTPAAIRRIRQYSNGLLRRINILADKSLLSAYATNKNQVTNRHVKTAARDSEFISSAFPYRYAVIAACLLVSILLLFWFVPVEKMKNEIKRIAAVAGTASDNNSVVSITREAQPAPSSQGSLVVAEQDTVYHEQDTSRFYDFRNPPSGELFDPVRPDYRFPFGDESSGTPGNGSTAYEQAGLGQRQGSSQAVDKDTETGEPYYFAWQANPFNARVSRDEADLLINQLKKLPPEAGYLAGDEDKCGLCASIIYRPLMNQENL